MKFYLLTICILGSAIQMSAAGFVYKDKNASIQSRVQDLLLRMTLQEKIMQLNQYYYGNDGNDNNLIEYRHKIPPTIGSLYFVGNVQERNRLQRMAMEESRLGIPILFGYDIIHGYRTNFQIGLGQACSWNPALVENMYHFMARETRRSGVDWVFTPMIDVARDARWGRISEGYGEDPYVQGVMGSAAVRGLQGSSLATDSTVASCLKHYVGYGASEAGRDYFYTEISHQTLWDTYLPPYKACIDAGATAVMSAFNNISGVPATCNNYTLREVLRQQLGFRGLVISDWDAVPQLKNMGYCDNDRTAAAACLNAGVDMEMVSATYMKHMAELIERGQVSMDILDESVSRVLELKFRLGLFEQPYTREDYVPIYLTEDMMQCASELAAQSAVLLKNEHTLPLVNQKKIAVVGPLAKNARSLIGNWAGYGRDEDVDVLYNGIVQEFSTTSEMRYAEGCGLESQHDADPKRGWSAITDTIAHEVEALAEAVSLAQWSDVVVVCLGEKAGWSGENCSRSSIALPRCQEQLVEAVKQTGKPVVIVLSNGRPIELCRIEPMADAIISIWQPGVNGASALAGILSGRINPSGKLAVTFPYTTGQEPIYYNRRKASRGGHQGRYQDVTSQPLYPFGHGLSYTQYSYSNEKIEKNADGWEVSVEVSNMGLVAGDEVVLWYISDPYSTITRPERELRHFERIHLAPGERRLCRFHINPMRDLAFTDDKGQPILEQGVFRVLVADKTLELKL